MQGEGGGPRVPARAKEYFYLFCHLTEVLTPQTSPANPSPGREQASSTRPRTPAYPDLSCLEPAGWPFSQGVNSYPPYTYPPVLLMIPGCCPNIPADKKKTPPKTKQRRGKWEEKPRG